MERAAERHRQTTVFESDHDASLSATYLDLQEVAWVDFREFDAVHLHTYECPKRGVPAWVRNATDANATAGARLSVHDLGPSARRRRARGRTEAVEEAKAAQVVARRDPAYGGAPIR